MSVSSKHPQYAQRFEDWEQLRDSYAGERVVKAKGARYLPATSGMILDGFPKMETKGGKAYSAYRTRSVFPGVVKAAVEAMLGVMHNKPPVIEVPDKLKPMLERATLGQESLAMLLRRINEEQILMGRIGLMLDVVDSVRPELPYIALYMAESGINWDDGTRDGTKLDSLNMVVLDETEDERTSEGFEWERKEKYRVLVLGDPKENEPSGKGARYSQGVYRDTSFQFDVANQIEPSIGGRKLERIPFVFVNSKDIAADPDDAPLLELSNIGMTIYRGEADYRQALFMQGQDTLVVTGSADQTDFRTGAGAAITLPIGGTAEFIGVNSEGLLEMRSALENDYKRAEQKSIQLISDDGGQKESGEALKLRVSSRTATLNQVALTGAFGLQEILRIAAEWVGANPDEVKVTPNLDFVDEKMLGKELADIMTAKGQGAPLSLESIHERMRERRMTDKTFEEEVKLIGEEAGLGILPVESTNPDGPEDNPPKGGAGQPNPKPQPAKRPT